MSAKVISAKEAAKAWNKDNGEKYNVGELETYTVDDKISEKTFIVFLEKVDGILWVGNNPYCDTKMSMLHTEGCLCSVEGSVTMVLVEEK